MREANSVWKLVLSIFALFLTVIIWIQGLQESFDRPSVTPKLSLTQNELALIAEPAVPDALKPVLTGDDPALSLSNALREIPLDQMDERKRLLLAILENSDSERRQILEAPFLENSLTELRRALYEGSINESYALADLDNLELRKTDPLLYRLTCLAIGESNAQCIDLDYSRTVGIRLFISQVIPFFGVLLGSILLLFQAWILLRKKSIKWPDVIELPLSLTDMTLLIAGGFVVLGEVVFPALLIPIVASLTQNIASPMNESLKVFFGYILMTIPPLFILLQQLKSLRSLPKPSQGWLQWLTIPVEKAFLLAARGWLMVLPVVLLVSWLMNSLVGDQGGSNPLLELVLSSRAPLPLILLVITTVVMAPLFEELIFRGALLPVLTNKFGAFLGVVVSALIFAIAHLSVGELPPLFVLGMGLGLLRLISGSVFACVLMHAFWNGITFINLVLIGG